MYAKIQTKPRAGRFWRQGEPFVWATGAALALTFTLTFALLAVVLWNGLGVFWPAPVAEVQLADGTKLLGEEVERDLNRTHTPRFQELEEKLGKLQEQLAGLQNELQQQEERKSAGKDGREIREIDEKIGKLQGEIEDLEPKIVNVRDEMKAYPGIESVKYKVGNMEDGPAFRWIEVNPDKFVAGRWIKENNIREISYPKNAFVLERTTNMNYYGLFQRLHAPGLELSEKGAAGQRLTEALQAVRRQYDRDIAPLDSRIGDIGRELRDHLKYLILRIDYQRKQLLAKGYAADSAEAAALGKRLDVLRAKETELNRESIRIATERTKLEHELAQNTLILTDSAGRDKSIPLLNIVRYTVPNEMGFWAKTGHYAAKIWDLLSTDPRESNQDGGLFPAIFGTVLLVFLMAIFCFPLGVLAGVYLGEYAKEGWLVQLVRIAVNNLAGIPSIVYGIFGLGFFIIFLGGKLDHWLYPECAGIEPVFGQGCILWASLTLGLLTIPVVIVSTEEALRAIPRGMREGSYAMGATKLQTLWRVLIPMASPGMMTGFILAMARAAGEVAPLMLTGAVKKAPVPFDGSFPYLHPTRAFMHLGFHIFDISCKSPNVEATKPMVYVTTLLLVFIVLTMSSLAIYLRNRMQKRYQIKSL